MTSPRLAFLLDTPDLSTFAWPDGAPEDIPDDVKPPTSRIQVAKVGTFKHPRYGKFTVTRATFDSFIANLPVVLADGTAPVDFDHEPDMGGKTAACGWITKLIPDGDRLLADVEWTWDGAYAIKERRYKFFSPTWAMHFVDDAGVDHGPALIGGGLTNRPFFNRMAVVNCSQQFSREDHAPAVEEAPGASDSRAAMPNTFATIAKQLGLGEDSSEEQVLTAARELAARAETSIEDAATAQGKVVMTAARAAELEAHAANGQAAEKRIEALEETAADTRFESAFTAALTDPAGARVTPAEKDALRQIFDASEEAFTTSLSLRQPVVQTAARGDAGDRDDAPAGVDAQRYSLHRKAEAYMAEHKVDYATALVAVERSNG